MSLLELHNFSVSFSTKNAADFVAVNAINLLVNKGQITGLIGESGSGKSVCSQSITKLIPSAKIAGNAWFNADSNKIDLLNCDKEALTKVRRTEIAYIFQEPMTALNPLINCGKQILECSSNPSKEVVQSLLLKVELLDTERVAKSYPHELSGGQRQRVMIAMALAKNPSLLIADEPTTALDVAVQTEILNLLKKLCAETNMGVLFITHDLVSLKGFADRIAVMYKGEIVEAGTSFDILNQPSHPYTKALIDSRATYNKKGTKLAEIDDLLKIEQGVLHYTESKMEKVVESPDSNEVILELNQVDKSHFKSSLFKKSETKVLKHINFELCQGDILGLIGESGSGKSTIAKLILKIWNQTEGEITLYSQKLENVQDLSKEIQLVFQDPYSSLNPKQRIGKALIEVLKTSVETNTKTKALSLLHEVGLSASDFQKYPHEFSGGQRQRICIAKALAKNPKIIVLDEAVSALDVSVQAKILNLLHKLKLEKGLTYLLISHDMNVVSYFCNKIIVLKQGEIVEMGRTENIIAKPNSAYTKSLLEHSIN